MTAWPDPFADELIAAVTTFAREPSRQARADRQRVAGARAHGRRRGPAGRVRRRIRVRRAPRRPGERLRGGGPRHGHAARRRAGAGGLPRAGRALPGPPAAAARRRRRRASSRDSDAQRDGRRGDDRPRTRAPSGSDEILRDVREAVHSAGCCEGAARRHPGSSATPTSACSPSTTFVRAPTAPTRSSVDPGVARVPDAARRRARACALSCPRGRHAVIEQLQGRLHALGEELIGQVAIGQRPGQLQGADHQSEERERVGSGSLGVCGVQACRDIVGGGELLRR